MIIYAYMIVEGNVHNIKSHNSYKIFARAYIKVFCVLAKSTHPFSNL